MARKGKQEPKDATSKAIKARRAERVRNIRDGVHYGVTIGFDQEGRAIHPKVNWKKFT